MRRLAPLLLIAAAVAACVSVEGLPDAKGALKPNQRLVVNLNVSPGPWIVDASDSKIETAAKILPVGFLMQTVQDEHTLGVSKDLQQYMPRPHYGIEVQDALMKALRVARSSTTVQTAVEAGIATAQLADWNRAKDQLDWRLRYYNPDPQTPAPRDYARALTLDDALVLDVNLSYGTVVTDDGQVEPQMSAASRVYRGDTSALIWEHEDEVVDKVSSTTLAEFKLKPSDLTDRIEKLAPQLAAAVAASFVKSFAIGGAPAAPAVAGSSATVAGSGGGGLLSLDYLQSLSSATVAVSTPTAVAISTPTAVAISTPAAVVVSTPTAPAIAASTPTVTVSSPTVVVPSAAAP